MAPLTPHWQQPSHPKIQEVVIVNETEFTTKSLSRVALAPFALFARFDFPPCTEAAEPTECPLPAARVDSPPALELMHVERGSRSEVEQGRCITPQCEIIIAGANGLQPGDELTFFYPSTEWEMAQPFQCLCGTPTCRGTIDGAKKMTSAQLDGLWLAKHIRELRAEQASSSLLATPAFSSDPTAYALQQAIDQAEKVVEAARSALLSYTSTATGSSKFLSNSADDVKGNGAGRRVGPTSRELSGEMGGDTPIRV
ncbi:hypothetical protein MY1884_005397 [Beauveria asiatica]